MASTPAALRQRTIDSNAKAIGDTKRIFDALVEHRMGFVKIASPLWEKQPSGQWSVVDCICPASSQTRADRADGTCGSIGKHPLGKAWEQHPTTEWSMVKSWLDFGFSVGLYPLAGCRVIGLDEDVEDAVANLFGSVGEDMPYLDTMVDTIRDRYHVFMLVPDDYPIDAITTGKFDGGDVLRDGLVRQFVAPNMLHVEGRRKWNGIETLMTASPAFLDALAKQSRDKKEAIAEARKPTDPGWEVKEGDRHGFLLTAAANLRNVGLTEAGIYAGLSELNAARCRPPKSDAEIKKISRDYSKKESVAEQPKITLNLNGHVPTDPGTLRTIASYRVEPVDWMWEGWMPRAEPVILEGLGGEGKSTFVVDVMSRLSRGDRLPDGAGNPYGVPVDSVYITGEDHPDRVLKPRFVAARADADRIHYWSTEFTIPEDLQKLADALSTHPEVRVVFIDPLFSHVDANLNTGSDSEVRKRIMNPLREIAHACDVTVLIARHLNKKGGDDPILRGSGTYGGLTGAARSVLQSISDPEDEDRERKIIGVIKANYGRMPKPWVYKLVGVTVDGHDGTPVETSKVEWLWKHEKFIDQIVEAGRKAAGAKGAAGRYEDKRTQADVDLGEILAPGELERQKVMDEMLRRGHTRDATYGARARLSVEVFQSGGNKGPYIWRLPGAKPGRQGHFDLPDE